MSDVTAARNIIDEIWPLDATPRKRVIGAAFEAVKRVERGLPKDEIRLRKRQWTERRVRSIVDEEAGRIDAYEMRDLEQMAIQEARDALRKSQDRSARLASFLARSAARASGEMDDR
ncbi:hypothetical protein OF122_13080 [Pelagibacterium flavum]|uniref:Uncharacterized protein n=1 Tax=Pelagibacterium flavum TaxID=2984530 RepID=A0ABY6INE1_9HYPH|nr:hypothetical protein [Pelagibacterium sp. YIM 151497]UYQ70992.1 hypothetical protein OF122_13080 [Pelagibacterium sp. YIM 151497]